jgi:hypothetical protein
MSDLTYLGVLIGLLFMAWSGVKFLVNPYDQDILSLFIGIVIIVGSYSLSKDKDL